MTEQPRIGKFRPAQVAPYPRNVWYVAAAGAELGRELLSRKLLGAQVVLFRIKDGAPVALSDWCPHRGFRLSKSKLIGDNIQCGYHGMLFDRAGECVHVPTQDTIPRNMKARSFPVIEKGLWVWIWMGDPKKADPALIPHTGLEERPYHNNFYFCYPMMGNFQLLHDNLLDASHVSFLHSGAVDNKDEVSSADVVPEIMEDVIRTTRVLRNFMPNERLASTFKLAEGLAVDRYVITESYLPSLAMVINRQTVANEPDRMLSEHIGHIPITPADERTAYHFFGVSSTFAPDNLEMAIERTRAVIAQDAVAVEAAQRCYEEMGSEFREFSVKADELALYGRRRIARMVAAEQRAREEPT